MCCVRLVRAHCVPRATSWHDQFDKVHQCTRQKSPFTRQSCWCNASLLQPRRLHKGLHALVGNGLDAGAPRSLQACRRLTGNASFVGPSAVVHEHWQAGSTVPLIKPVLTCSPCDYSTIARFGQPRPRQHDCAPANFGSEVRARTLRGPRIERLDGSWPFECKR